MERSPPAIERELSTSRSRGSAICSRSRAAPSEHTTNETNRTATTMPLEMARKSVTAWVPERMKTVPIASPLASIGADRSMWLRDHRGASVRSFGAWKSPMPSRT
jgi:hypothetical protein